MDETPKKRILILDDEDVVRKVMVLMLERSGFEAVTATEGAEAVRKWLAAKDAGTPFDLGIFDLTIPAGMGGVEAGRNILAQDSSAAIMMSSGYSNDPIVSEYPLHGFKGVLIKPFRLDDLLAAIRKVL